jgi:shikimate kinase
MAKIILIGMKSSGKTTTGQALSKKLGIKFIDLDSELEKTHFIEKKETLWFREIFKKYGQVYFRSLELVTLTRLSSNLENTSFVLATGGGTPLDERNQKILQELGTIIFLDINKDILLSRIISQEIPAFFPYPDNPQKSLIELLKTRRPAYARIANITCTFNTESPELLADKIVTKLADTDNAN